MVTGQIWLRSDGNAHFMLYSTVGYVKTLLKDGNAHFMLESRLREDIVKGWAMQYIYKKCQHKNVHSTL